MLFFDSEINIQIIEKEYIPYNLKINHKLVHSNYDPHKEAKRQLEDIIKLNQKINFVICYKVGLGYSIEYLIQNTNYHIVWIEPNSLIKSLALKRLEFNIKNFNEIYENRITFLEHFDKNYIQEISKDILRYEIFYLKSYLEKYDYVLIDLFYRKRFYAEVNYNTIKKFEKNWIANFYKNIIYYNKINFINKLNRICNDLSAIIVAGGPSLDLWIQEIKEVKEKFIIIAVDTAVKTLLKADIIPDFIITVDAQVINYFHMECNIKTPIYVIADPTVSHLTIKHFLKHYYIFFYNNSLPIVNYVYSILKEDVHFLKSGGSVSTTALDFANFIGCKKIFFVGLDFGFPRKHVHTKFSSIEYRILYKIDRLMHLEYYNFKQLTAVPKKYCVDIKNNKVITNDKLLIFKTWFEKNYSKYQHMDLFLLYGGGCFVPYIKLITNRKEFFKEIQSKINKQQLFSIMKNDGSKDKLNLNYTLENLYNNFNKINLLIKEILNVLRDLLEENENQELIIKLQNLESELFKYNELKMIHFNEHTKLDTFMYKENLEISIEVYKTIARSVIIHLNYLRKSLSILHFLELE